MFQTDSEKCESVTGLKHLFNSYKHYHASLVLCKDATNAALMQNSVLTTDPCSCLY